MIERLTDPDQGMFPKGQEIRMHCDCPDGALLCKHLAAVLYGVGNRLDASPELLFTLRGVNQTDLVAESLANSELSDPIGIGEESNLHSGDLESIFGINLAPTAQTKAPAKRKTKRKSSKKKTTKKKAVKKKAVKKVIKKQTTKKKAAKKKTVKKKGTAKKTTTQKANKKKASKKVAKRKTVKKKAVKKTIKKTVKKKASKSPAKMKRGRPSIR
ncbi:MAG: hypothetical protein V3V20_09855 [Algisphaera sp.]